MPRDRGDGAQRVLFLGALVLWLPFGVYATLASEDALIRFFPDDAFYYLQPAVNFVRLGFPTFDGVHLTNGFHPLNFLLVSFFATLFSRITLLRVTFALDMALVVGAFAWVVSQRTRNFSAIARLLLLAVLTLPIFTGFLTLSSGMESALLVLCTVALLVAWDAAERQGFLGIGHNLVLGLAIGAVVLARLDVGVALVPLMMFLALQAIDHLRARRPKQFARLAGVFLVAAVLIAAYLTVNFILMGHLLPISGYVKQLWVGSANSWGPSTRGASFGLLLTLLPALTSLIAVVRSVRAGAIGSVVALLNVGNLLFYVYLAFGVAHVFRWYYAFPLTCLTINIVDLGTAFGPIRSLASNERRVSIRAMAAVTLVVLANAVFLVWVGGRESSTSYQLKKVSELVNQYGGPDAVSGVQDAGVIGYFATGRVINLDGLANDYDYVDNYLRRQRVAEYLRREGATHVLVRDGMLMNAEVVANGTHETARSALDPELMLAKREELFRYELPGQFRVYYFRLGR